MSIDDFEIVAVQEMKAEQTSDRLSGVVLTITKKTISDDGQSYHLEFNGACDIPWNHHYQTIMGGKHKGKTLQVVNKRYLQWTMGKCLERAVSIAAELTRRDIVDKLSE